MSVQAMSWVFDHSESELAARLVLLSIANHCDAHGRNAFPSQETIADEAHVSVRTVKRCIVTLAEAGELSVENRKGQAVGRARTNYYELPEFIASLAATRGQSVQERRGDIDGSEPADEVTSDAGRGDICADEGPTVAPQEPSLEPSEPSSSSEDEEEVLAKLVDLKLAARLANPDLRPIIAKARWKRTTRQDEIDNNGFVHEHAAACLEFPAASTDEIARYLFDGTAPSSSRRPSCPTCCDEFDTTEARDDHYANCFDGWVDAAALPVPVHHVEGES